MHVPLVKKHHIKKTGQRHFSYNMHLLSARKGGYFLKRNGSNSKLLKMEPCSTIFLHMQIYLLITNGNYCNLSREQLPRPQCYDLGNVWRYACPTNICPMGSHNHLQTIFLMLPMTSTCNQQSPLTFYPALHFFKLAHGSLSLLQLCHFNSDLGLAPLKKKKRPSSQKPELYIISPTTPQAVFCILDV